MVYQSQYSMMIQFEFRGVFGKASFTDKFKSIIKHLIRLGYTFDINHSVYVWFSLYLLDVG